MSRTSRRFIEDLIIVVSVVIFIGVIGGFIGGV